MIFHISSATAMRANDRRTGEAVSDNNTKLGGDK